MPFLFSYGTLQQEAVQLSTFGRLLQGQRDELVGFERSLRRIEDPRFVAASGKAEHAIVQRPGCTLIHVLRDCMTTVAIDTSSRLLAHRPGGIL